MRNNLLGIRFMFMNKEARKVKMLPFENKYEVFNHVCQKAITKLRVKVNVSGTNFIPLYDGCLFIGNHQEIFDYLFLTVSNPNSSYFVVNSCDLKSRKLKRWYKLLEALDSSNVISKKIEIILRTQENVTCFAEEETSKTNDVLKFKPNAFVAAINAKAPIVPFVIKSHKFNRNKNVTVIYLQPIHYEEYKDYSLNELVEKVQNLIQETLHINM